MKIGIESNILRSIFKNVYFINGTAYAGKSTMIKLLAEKHDGIMCGENYSEKLFDTIDKEHQPNLCYFQTMSGWQEFLSRSPKKYDAWIQGCSREGTDLELVELIRLSQTGKKIFVDTNIPLELLSEISDYDHVAIMLNPRSMSVERFFERADPEKQFLLEQIHQAENPEKTMANFRACIAEINSETHYNEFAESGFFVHVRDGSSTIDETLAILEKHFKL